ncbi:hypothetical protein LCGC14_1530050 [marine sediment metagenome]|uniref:Uncharacterized protein n=1 Tax=marine sediment metagenome TaxID=412755 RepID=A0A0F9LX11_9ZZZZ
MPDGEEEGADEARRVPNRMPDPVGEVVTALEAFGVDRRQVGTDSTPFGILSPGLGSSTLETRRQAALEAVLQTQTDPIPVNTSPSRFPPHAEFHMAGGDDEVHSFDIISVYNQLLMRPGWEDESLRVSQEEITPATGVGIQTQMHTDFVATSLIRMYSAAKPSGERVRAEFAAKQASLTYPVVRVVLVDSADTPIREATISAVVDLGATDFVRLSMRGDTVAGGLTELNLDCTDNSESIAIFTGTAGRMRVTGIATPIISADATPKDYVDGLTVPVVAEGDIIIANATPAWAVLTLSVPAANVRNVLGVDNGETQPTWKTALDAMNPANAGGAAAPGTSLVFSHRDHVHAVDATHSGSAHHAEAHAAAEHNAAVLPASANEDLGAFYLDIDGIAVPSNPGAGVRRLFVDTATGEVSVLTSAGVTTSLEAISGSALNLTEVKLIAEVYA